MVEDVKAVLSVSWIFLPLPIFWSLFFQTYSTWVIQVGSLPPPQRNRVPSLFPGRPA
jgi:dipeptide/tripeptide permease